MCPPSQPHATLSTCSVYSTCAACHACSAARCLGVCRSNDVEGGGEWAKCAKFSTMSLLPSLLHRHSTLKMRPSRQFGNNPFAQGATLQTDMVRERAASELCWPVLAAPCPLLSPAVSCAHWFCLVYACTFVCSYNTACRATRLATPSLRQRTGAQLPSWQGWASPRCCPQSPPSSSPWQTPPCHSSPMWRTCSLD